MSDRDWAVVGIIEMSESQKNLRDKYPINRIRKISMMDAMQEAMKKIRFNKDKQRV